MSQSIFKNPFVSTPPTLAPGSVGNGTLTVDRLTHFTVDQQYTVICSAISPFTVFNVIGNLDGAVGVAVVGDQFTDEDNKLFITIQQGPTLFQIGDTFTFTVKQGTDLNQQNLDAFDELPQKNFGPGITGLLKGDHNIRFNGESKKASRIAGQLVFTAKEEGLEGNEISFEFLLGTVLATASKTIQGFHFTAKNPGAAGNNISVEFKEIVPPTPAYATLGNIEFFADEVGEVGNGITVEYVGGGSAGSEFVVVSGRDIIVQIEDGVSTSNNIELAIALHPQASQLVDTARIDEDGELPQFIGGPVTLTGGIDGDPLPIVRVDGSAITISFEPEATEEEEILDLLLNSTEAMALVDVEYVGDAEDVVEVTQPEFLVGGQDELGEPGNETVSVQNKHITVIVADGTSTAAQVKQSIEANPEAAALIDISFLGEGSEFQPSPISFRFLSGGLASAAFSFNTKELSEAEDFHEGNAAILVKDIVNQGNETTFGDTTKKGLLTLDDDTLGNVSGPKIENSQKTINNIIHNGKAFLMTADNSKIVWEMPLLSFEADILFVFPETNVINKVLLANSPIEIEDGEHVYVEVNRLSYSELTVYVGTIIPTGENFFRLCSRRDEDLIWYDNTLQRQKKKIRIGEGGGGGTAYQENIGFGNGSEKKFPLTFVPSNEQSILLICSYIREYGVDYLYNPIGNQIEFETGRQPQKGQQVYVFYLTDGDTVEVPSPSGQLQSYTHIVTESEELAKEITLVSPPAQPSKILVDIIGGGSQEFNEDFTISTDKFQWGGFRLDGFLSKDDRVRFYFYS
jgi:hypothetical protein